MTTRLPETTFRRTATLPAPALALEAYWHLLRHRWVYAGQLVALAAATWLAYAVIPVMASVVAVVYARLSPRFDRLYRVFD